MSPVEDRILYEDNHLIVVDKMCGELSQGDDTGDRTLADAVKAYLKSKYSKPGNVYLGIPHRLDRPTSGVMVYARTEKALVRLNDAFRTDDVSKTYWAIVDRLPPKDSDTLTHYIVSAGHRSVHRTPSPDKGAAQGDRPSHKGRPEVRLSQEQPGWRHLPSCKAH